MLKRRLTLQGTIDPASNKAVEHDLTAAGHGDLPVEGKLSILGNLATAVPVGYGAIVRCYNNDQSVHFVAVGIAAMGAPSTPANGIPIPANSYITINTADQGEFIRSDNAKVFGYQLLRDSSFIIVPDANS